MSSLALAHGADADADSNAVSEVVVHPLVLFHALDHFSRRNQGQARVIGTLLGHRVEGTGVVHCTDAFAVPHKEDDEEVMVALEFNKQMLQLHSRVNPREEIVGWYSTAVEDEGGNFVANTENCLAIYDSYQEECENPIHLVLDTSLGAGRLNPRAYISKAFFMGGEPVAAQILSVRTRQLAHAQEAIAVHTMAGASTYAAKGKGQEWSGRLALGRESSKGHGASKELKKSIGKLIELLSSVRDYVDDVVAGKLQGDEEIGHTIEQALDSVPSSSASTFERDFHGAQQDLLMVGYLSNLVRTHLAISQKLSSSVATGTALAPPSAQQEQQQQQQQQPQQQQQSS